MPLFGVENKLTVNRLPLITSLCEELSPPRGSHGVADNFMQAEGSLYQRQ